MTNCLTYSRASATQILMGLLILCSLGFSSLRAQTTIGAGGGYMRLASDVDSDFKGWNYGKISWYKPIKYNNTIELEFGAGSAYGFDPQRKLHGAFRGPLVEDDYKDYAVVGGLYLSYKTFISYLLVKNHFEPFVYFSRSNSSFLKGLSIHIAGGAYYHKTQLNLYDEQGAIYNFSTGTISADRIKFSLDNEYETTFSQDNLNIKPLVGIGLSARLFHSWNCDVHFSYSFLNSFSDYLDGQMYHRINEKTNNNDWIQLMGINVKYKF